MNQKFLKAAASVVVALSLLAVGTWVYTAYCNQQRLVVVILSYNNMPWYKKNLAMLKAQEHTNWKAVYVDDASPDGTGQAVERYLKENNLTEKVTLIKNSTRRGALANIYDVVHTLRDRDIVVVYDGDDWFAHTQVLSRVADAYKNNDVWLTYGQYKEHPERFVGATEAFPQAVIDRNLFRQYRWISSHLRTFYAGLFKRIEKKDLLYNGEFFAKAGDMAIMFPMLEMAGNRIKRMDEILYVYNLENPLNDWKDDLGLVLTLDRYIRSQKPYNRLKELAS